MLELQSFAMPKFCSRCLDNNGGMQGSNLKSFTIREQLVLVKGNATLKELCQGVECC